MSDPAEALGVNDRKQLAQVAAIQRRRILDRLMAEGVTVLDPAATYVDDTVTIGTDTVLYPNVLIEGATTIGSDCRHRHRLSDRAPAGSPTACGCGPTA